MNNWAVFFDQSRIPNPWSDPPYWFGEIKLLHIVAVENIINNMYPVCTVANMACCWFEYVTHHIGYDYLHKASEFDMKVSVNACISIRGMIFVIKLWESVIDCISYPRMRSVMFLKCSMFSINLYLLIYYVRHELIYFVLKLFEWYMC